MKPDDLFENHHESTSEMLDSAIEKQRWQVEYMESSLEIISEAKRKIMLLMDHYKDGKMKEDITSEILWKKMDEADCRLMESMIAIAEAIGNIVSEGVVSHYNKR